MKDKYCEYIFLNIHTPLQEIALGKINYLPDVGDLANKNVTDVQLSVQTDTTFGSIGIHEELYIKSGHIEKRFYVYHAYNPLIKGEDGTLLRYDNSTHHPHLDNYPHHKHIGTSLPVSNYATTIKDFVKELTLLKDSGMLDNLLKDCENNI